ncbi:hypothetical protein MASR1M90_14170 [Desulfovibrionales bacterium]
MKTQTPLFWRIQALHIMIILALSTVMAVSFNAMRPNPLPVFGPSHTSLAPAPDATISLDEAQALHARSQALFVDARDALTYAQGHIQGAVSLPVDDFPFVFPALQSRLVSQPLVIYCDGASCTLSVELISLLKAQGLTTLVELHDGWTAWSQAGLPTTSGELP